MSNLRILANNIHDTTTLTATSEAMPVENTQRSERPFTWRSVDLQTQVIEATLQDGAYIDCIALARHNLGPLGSVRFECFLGDFTDDKRVKDSGEMPTAMLIPAGIWRAGIDPWGATYNELLPGGSSLAIYWLDTPVAADRYRITLSSSDTSPTGYFEIGRIFSGLSFAPSVNMNWGTNVRWVESSEHIRTEGGSMRTVGTSELYRAFDFKLDWLADTDRQRLVTELAKAGRERDLLVSLYPQSGGLHELEHTMICRRINNFAHNHNHYNNWQAQFEFEEV